MKHTGLKLTLMSCVCLPCAVYIDSLPIQSFRDHVLAWVFYSLWLAFGALGLIARD